MAINSSVRWFTSDMAGAPAIENVEGGLIATLDACLINGFGGVSVTGISVSSEVATVTATAHGYQKHAVIQIAGATPSDLNGDWRIATVPTADTFTFAAPGLADGSATGTITAIRATPGHWEKQWSATNIGAYRSTHPDGTGIVLRVDDTPTGVNASPVLCYESMSAIDTGVNPFPIITNFVWRRTATSTAGQLPRPWALVADERWFCLLLDFNATTTNPGALYQFGDVVSAAEADSYACYVTGNAAATPASIYSSSSQNDFSGSNVGQYFARNRAGAVGAVPARRYGSRRIDEPGDGEAFPSVYNGGYLFHHPCTLHQDDGVLRGLQPAFWQGLTARAGTLSAPYAVLDPSATLPVALLVHECGRSGATGVSYIGFDIWGPWR
jgi:hypothetical protein